MVMIVQLAATQPVEAVGYAFARDRRTRSKVVQQCRPQLTP